MIKISMIWWITNFIPTEKVLQSFALRYFHEFFVKKSNFVIFTLWWFSMLHVSFFSNLILWQKNKFIGFWCFIHVFLHFSSEKMLAPGHSCNFLAQKWCFPKRIKYSFYWKPTATLILFSELLLMITSLKNNTKFEIHSSYAIQMNFILPFKIILHENGCISKR